MKKNIINNQIYSFLMECARLSVIAESGISAALLKEHSTLLKEGKNELDDNPENIKGVNISDNELDNIKSKELASELVGSVGNLKSGENMGIRVIGKSAYVYNSENTSTVNFSGKSYIPYLKYKIEGSKLSLVGISLLDPENTDEILAIPPKVVTLFKQGSKSSAAINGIDEKTLKAATISDVSLKYNNRPEQKKKPYGAKRNLRSLDDIEDIDVDELTDTDNEDNQYTFSKESDQDESSRDPSFHYYDHQRKVAAAKEAKAKEEQRVSDEKEANRLAKRAAEREEEETNRKLNRETESYHERLNDDFHKNIEKYIDNFNNQKEGDSSIEHKVNRQDKSETYEIILRPPAEVKGLDGKMKRFIPKLVYKVIDRDENGVNIELDRIDLNGTPANGAMQQKFGGFTKLWKVKTLQDLEEISNSKVEGSEAKRPVIEPEAEPEQEIQNDIEDNEATPEEQGLDNNDSNNSFEDPEEQGEQGEFDFPSDEEATNLNSDELGNDSQEEENTNFEEPADLNADGFDSSEEADLGDDSQEVDTGNFEPVNTKNFLNITYKERVPHESDVAKINRLLSGVKTTLTNKKGYDISLEDFDGYVNQQGTVHLVGNSTKLTFKTNSKKTQILVLEYQKNDNDVYVMTSVITPMVRDKEVRASSSQTVSGDNLKKLELGKFASINPANLNLTESKFQGVNDEESNEKPGDENTEDLGVDAVSDAPNDVSTDEPGIGNQEDSIYDTPVEDPNDAPSDVDDAPVETAKVTLDKAGNFATTVSELLSNISEGVSSGQFVDNNGEKMYGYKIKDPKLSIKGKNIGLFPIYSINEEKKELTFESIQFYTSRKIYQLDDLFNGEGNRVLEIIKNKITNPVLDEATTDAMGTSPFMIKNKEEEMVSDTDDTEDMEDIQSSDETSNDETQIDDVANSEQGDEIQDNTPEVEPEAEVEPEKAKDSLGVRNIKSITNHLNEYLTLGTIIPVSNQGGDAKFRGKNKFGIKEKEYSLYLYYYETKSDYKLHNVSITSSDGTDFIDTQSNDEKEKDQLHQFLLDSITSLNTLSKEFVNGKETSKPEPKEEPKPEVEPEDNYDDHTDDEEKVTYNTTPVSFNDDDKEDNNDEEYEDESENGYTDNSSNMSVQDKFNELVKKFKNNEFKGHMKRKIAQLLKNASRSAGKAVGNSIDRVGKTAYDAGKMAKSMGTSFKDGYKDSKTLNKDKEHNKYFRSVRDNAARNINKVTHAARNMNEDESKEDN